jgi:hypothetical protein
MSTPVFATRAADYLRTAQNDLTRNVLTILTDVRYGSPEKRAECAVELIRVHVASTGHVDSARSADLGVSA